MSSYQFVNSLSSCYGPGRTGPDGGVGGPPGDYYSQQVYNGWPGANPTASNVAAAAAAAAAAAVGQSPTTPPYSAYLQQNGDHHGAHPLAHHRDLYANNSCSQQALVNQSRLSHHSSQLMQSSRTSTSPNCKFGLDSASSPQDLSTSSGGTGQSPEPRSGSPRVQVNSNQNSSQQSSNGTSQSKGSFSSSSNPPHIYPWMRKVHVGQSEYWCTKVLRLQVMPH